MTNFALLTLFEKLDDTFFTLKKQWSARDSKLYLYIDLIPHSKIEFFMLNKASNFKVVIHGASCRLVQFEPVDPYLVPLRKKIK